MPKALARVGSMLAAVFLIVATWTVTAQREAAALDPFTGYLMAHFTGESASGEQIYFSHSTNGLTGPT